MNVKRAAVGLSGHAAMLTHFVAVSDPVGRGLPGCIVNRICALSEVLSNKVVNLIALIPKHLTSRGTESSPRPLGWLSADLAWLAWPGSLFTTSSIAALDATINRSLAPVLGLEKLLAGRTNLGRRSGFGFPVAWARAKLCLSRPLLHGNGRMLNKGAAAGLTLLGKWFSYHVPENTMLRLTCQGNA